MPPSTKKIWAGSTMRVRCTVSARVSASKPPNWNATSGSAQNQSAAVSDDDERAERAEHGGEEPLGRLGPPLLARARVERDEGDGERAAGQQVVQDVGELEGRAIGVHLRAHARPGPPARPRARSRARARAARSRPASAAAAPIRRAWDGSPAASLTRSPRAAGYPRPARFNRAGSAPARAGRRSSRRSTSSPSRPRRYG